MGTHKSDLIFKKKKKEDSGNNRFNNSMCIHGRILKWFNQGVDEHLGNKAGSTLTNLSGSVKTGQAGLIFSFESAVRQVVSKEMQTCLDFCHWKSPSWCLVEKELKLGFKKLATVVYSSTKA